jgi:hypothetical protein
VCGVLAAILRFKKKSLSNGTTVVIEFFPEFSKQITLLELSSIDLRTVTELEDHILLDFRDCIRRCPPYRDGRRVEI